VLAGCLRLKYPLVRSGEAVSSRNGSPEPRQSLVRSVLLALIVGCVLATPVFALELFNSEPAAQQHCPTDRVVWLNLPTMIWHYKRQRWYGNTKHGAYVCQSEAAAGGARATRNGE
jgi:hypothetical protein